MSGRINLGVTMKYREVLSLFVCVVFGTDVLIGTAQADIKLSESTSFYGDVRAGLFTRDRDRRDGTDINSEDFRTRIRGGFKFAIDKNWSAAVRAAGRYSGDSNKNDNHSELFSSIPGSDGLRFGDSTLDALYVHYKQDNWGVQIGRFQYKKELEGVARKALNYGNSVGVDITWTDGIRAHLKTGGGWNWDAIVHHAQGGGPTMIRRPPIAFTEDDSHWEYYVGVVKTDKKGLWLQRGLDFTYIPDALRTDGTATGKIDDVAVVTGRLAMQWPIGSGDTKFIWANGFGYAFDTPKETVVKTGASGDSDGTAFQTSVNLTDLWPGHSFGLVYVRAGGGYLMSPDIPNNARFIEGRWAWKFAKDQKFEIRYRVREDLKKQVGALDRREDTDMFFRWTMKL